jgi:hypothetical protein
MRGDREFKARQRAMWALADNREFATSSIWDFGPLQLESGVSGPERQLRLREPQAPSEQRRPTTA